LVLPASASPAWRWRILALLFFATTINYLDRIVFSVLIPLIREEMHISDRDYGFLTGAFTGAYTVGFLAAGKFIDRYGTRIGYAVSIVWWSLAAALHTLAKTPLELGVWRAALGFGEAGNFPSAIKAVAEWFPKRDRAFATGIFNAGSNVASMIGPPLFVWMSAHYGWRGCFLITSGLGFVWVVFWFLLYRKPPRQDDDAAEEPVGWGKALTYRQTWGFALGKFLTDPVWWFYLYWLPPYLYDVRKFNLTEIGWALPVVYLMADVGSVGGGWISGWLIRRGWQTARARRAAMLLCAVSMPVAAMSAFAGSAVAVIALVSIATAAHQGWSANLYTTTSDTFPKNVVASVTGIGGCAGGLGGFLFSSVIPGLVITHFGYTPMIVFMGALHLAAWLALNALLWARPSVRIE
jgi:ACS family hexuronate transporter-like MFS transporter